MSYDAKLDWEYNTDVTEHDINRWEKGIKDAHDLVADHENRIGVIEEEMGEGTPYPTTLLPGLQIITVPRGTPFNVLNLKGRTLINLLGRYGNCEDISKLTQYQGTITADASNKTLGSQGVKLTIGSGYTQATSGITGTSFKAGKYYIMVADVKNGNATSVSIQSVGTGNSPAFISATPSGTNDNTKFTTVAIKYAPTSDVVRSVEISVIGSVGQYAYFDALRCYEITQAEYNALDSMTPEQIATKYPYVDDFKPVRGAYLIRYGKNLLPPLTEWENTHATETTIVSAYKAAMNATGDQRYVRKYISVVPNQTYTFSAQHNGKIGVSFQDALGNSLGGTGYQTGQAITFTTPANCTRILVQLSNYGIGAGTFTFENPMLNIGSAALPFEPQNNDYIFIDGTFHGMNGVSDEVVVRDGKVSGKLKWFEEVVLDGSLPWAFSTDYTGYKVVALTNSFLDRNRNALPVAVKYDGKILKNGVVGTDGADCVSAGGWQHATANDFYISIADPDSGWAEAWAGTTLAKSTYTTLTRDATATDMIKALVNGWVWDETNKRWYERGNPGVTSSDVDFVINNYASTMKNGTYTPMKLLYQLATPVEVPVTSEGEISLFEGANVLEVGTGVVVREPVIPVYDSGSGNYQINSASNPLKNKVSRVLSIYNGTKLTEFTTGVRDISSPYYSTLGAGYGHVLASVYDPTAAYSATYIAEKYAYTAPLLDLQGEYRTKLAEVVAELAQDQADLAKRVSVVETQYARKQQGQWIAPVLLNGWTFDSWMKPGYYKDEFGIVHLKGTLKNGTITGLSPAFKLPVGYRPIQYTPMSILTFSNASTPVIGRLVVDSSGSVYIDFGSNYGVCLDGISFRAEL